MAVDLILIGNPFLEDCDPANGTEQYIVQTYATRCGDIDLEAAVFNVSSDVIEIPWLTGGRPWVLITPVEDDSAYYKETYSDDRGIVVQDSFVKVNGISTNNILSFNIYKETCCLVLLHILNTGEGLLQGVDKVFYDGEWHLITTVVKASKGSGAITTGINKAPANMGMVFTSISKNYMLMVLEPNVLLGIFEEEEPEYPPPSVVIYRTGMLINAIEGNDNGCGHVTVTTAVYVNTAPENYVNVERFPYDIQADFCNIAVASGATHITISATAWSRCGQTTVTETVPITVVDGRISRIDSVPCNISPTVSFSLAGSVLSKVVSDGCGCGMSAEVYGINLVSSTLTIPAGDFPVDLSDLLCGESLTSTGLTSLTLGATITNNDGASASTSFPIPITQNGTLIASVNGVSCGVLLPPTVELTLTGKILSIVWNAQGDPSPTKELVLDLGYQTVNLNPGVSSIDLADHLAWLQIIGGTLSPSFMITAFISNTVGSATDGVSVPCQKTGASYGSRIKTINGVNLYTQNTVTLGSPIVVGTGVTGITSVNYNGWHVDCVLFKFNIRDGGYGFYTQSVPNINSALLNLNTFCGDVYTSNSFTLEYEGDADGNISLGSPTTVPVVRNVSDEITSINGVSCSTPPSISLTIVGTELTAITVDGGGEDAEVTLQYSTLQEPNLQYDTYTVSTLPALPIDLKAIFCGAEIYPYETTVHVTGTVTQASFDYAEDIKDVAVLFGLDGFTNKVRSVAGVACTLTPYIYYEDIDEELTNIVYDDLGDPTATVEIRIEALNGTWYDVVDDSYPVADIATLFPYDMKAVVCGSAVSLFSTYVQVYVTIVTIHGSTTYERSITIGNTGGLITSVNGISC